MSALQAGLRQSQFGALQLNGTRSAHRRCVERSSLVDGWAVDRGNLEKRRETLRSASLRIEPNDDEGSPA